MNSVFPDGIARMTPHDELWPMRLSTIADPPKQLFVRGQTSLLRSTCVAVVGSRRASPYGTEACSMVASSLARAGITVVSGMAFGIDSIAHTSALENDGSTIAVLGSGIDNASMTPREHEPLGRRIDGPKGLILSEYEPGNGATKYSYPERNRIISGISQATIIVEADIKSGSLITAKCALDQGRDVYAVPGSIFWPRSEGTNWLIAQGAHPLLHIEEVIERVHGAQPPLLEKPQKMSIVDDSLEERIVSLLSQQGPLHMDAIVGALTCSAPEAMIALSMLELSARIRSAHGTYRIT